MRKRETIKIDYREVTVMELTVQDIMELFQADKEADFLELVNTWLPRTTDLTLEEMKTMAPSELEQVFNTWKEVNSAFFRMARAAGLGQILTELQEAMKQDFVRLFFASLKPGTQTS